MKQTNRANRRILPLALSLLWLGVPAWGAPPDATAPGARIDTTFSFNLGATGARGWIYNTGSDGGVSSESSTTESRQILVASVDAGSPADGILQVKDVILGLGATLFTSDARQAFGWALGRAEAKDGLLKLKVWRNGVIQDNVTVKLPVLGAYSATAPYNCSKSTQILANAGNYLAGLVAKRGFKGNATANDIVALALLAAGNTNDLPMLRDYARSVAKTIPPAATSIKDDGSMVSWTWGYHGLFLSEYYLATGDAEVLHAIKVYTLSMAQGQSLLGTYGHGMASPVTDGSSGHGFVPPYGPLAQAGELVNIAVALGRKVIVTSGGKVDPEIDTAIMRGRRFFGYYAGKGAVPYRHDMGENFHDDNGKNGLAAVLMALQGQEDMSWHAQYFAKSCTAAYAEREGGHTGSFWAKLWQPLGANVGGAEAMAAYFHAIEWDLDMNRRPNGSFVYMGAGGQPTPYYGYFSEPGPETAEYILTYAVALKKLYITGKNADRKNWISASDVKEAIVDGDWMLKANMKSWTTNQLVSALASWSTQKRFDAVQDLLNRTNDLPSLVPGLMVMAEGKNVNLRQGATLALALTKDKRALPVLVRRLSDSDYFVRVMALGYYAGLHDLRKALLAQPEASSVLTNMLATVIRNEVPFDPLDWRTVDFRNDPAMLAQESLGTLLCSAPLGHSVSGVPTNLLYPAIGALSRTVQPWKALGYGNGLFANVLSTNDVRALAPVLVKALMNSHIKADPWAAGFITTLLAKYRFDEGIAAAMLFHNYEPYWGPYGDPWGPTYYWHVYTGPANSIAALGQYGAAAAPALAELAFWNTNVNARGSSPLGGSLKPGQFTALMTAIQTNMTAGRLPAMHCFKTIHSVAAAPAVFASPVTTAKLKASASTIAGNPLTYAWRKVRGAGDVVFGPNGTTNSSETTARFSVPGNYLLQLTVADAFINQNRYAVNGYRTNLPYGGVTTNLVVIFNGLTNQTYLPPTATALNVTVDENTHAALALSGLDPQGHELIYTVSSSPTNGTLLGLVPNLVYTPKPNFYGHDSFAFTVMNSEGMVSSKATVSLTVRPVPTVPLALNRSLLVTSNTATAILLAGLDSNHFPLTYKVLAEPTHGTLTGTAPDLVYQPARDYIGKDSFTFRVNNGHYDSANPATVALTTGAIRPGIRVELFLKPAGAYPEKLLTLTPSSVANCVNALYFIDEHAKNFQTADSLTLTNLLLNTAMQVTGFLKVPAAGEYRFLSSANPEMNIYVDNTLVNQSHFPNPGQWKQHLAAGYHGIRMTGLKQYSNGVYFRLFWSGPGFAERIVPASALFCSEGDTTHK